jgi:catechol 2,3-dioxygenase-like lactoylglutathione lyase family enzyme
MKPQLNHTIVLAHDQKKSAGFLAEILGLDEPSRFASFLVVEAGNGVSLDYFETSAAIPGQHYAFLVTEQEFDEIFARVKKHALEFWADPSLTRPGEINHGDGGRGVYFPDPDGHLLEILTRPYGSGPVSRV